MQEVSKRAGNGTVKAGQKQRMEGVCRQSDLTVSAPEPKKTGKNYASVIGEAVASSLLYTEL